MATTYQLISSVTVGSGGASSIDFTSIPATYTDLVLKVSVRGEKAAKYISLAAGFNNTSNTTNWSKIQLEGGDGSVTSTAPANANIGFPPASQQTASTFGSAELYIPNYTSSNNKSSSSDSVGEGNEANNVYADLMARLWSNTSAINRITLTADTGNLAQYSTAYLYGIKSS